MDFDNNVVHVSVTKNRKSLLIPLNMSVVNILKEFLQHRQHKSDEDYLFCNTFGQQTRKGNLLSYAKQWILNSGNVVTLSWLLGHSRLDITQNYINLLVRDLAKEVESMDLLDKFGKRKCIRIK